MEKDITYKLVKIQWADSYGCSSTWEKIESSEPLSRYCYSVGWVTSESDEAIVITPHLSPENEEIGAIESGCGDMTIPKCSIKKMTVFAKREERAMGEEW